MEKLYLRAKTVFQDRIVVVKEYLQFQEHVQLDTSAKQNLNNKLQKLLVLMEIMGHVQ